MKKGIQQNKLFFEVSVILIFTILARTIFKMSLCVMPFYNESDFHWSVKNGIDFLIIFLVISISWMGLRYIGLYLWALLTFILALVNHYVVILHNSPLTLQELSNLKTALNVFARGLRCAISRKNSSE